MATTLERFEVDEDEFDRAVVEDMAENFDDSCQLHVRMWREQGRTEQWIDEQVAMMTSYLERRKAEVGLS